MRIVEHQSSCFEMRIHRYSVSQTDQMVQSMNCLRMPEKDQSRSFQHLQMMIDWHQCSCSEMRIHKYLENQIDQMELSMNCWKMPEMDQSRRCQHLMGLPVGSEQGQSRSFQPWQMMIVGHQSSCFEMGIHT
jgi:hypothetical protein